MAKGFQVVRIDGETGARTKVGTVCKTGDKAINLKARMRAQQELGSSNWFEVEAAK